MRWLLVAALLAGCNSTVEHYPPRPGGPIGGVTDSPPDAATPYDGGEDDGLWRIRGRVCPIVDLRTPRQCTQSYDLDGIYVVEQGGDYAEVQTSTTGTFLIALEPRPYAALEAERELPYYVPSVARVERYVDDASVRMPLVDRDAWVSLLAGLDTQLPDGNGAIAVYLLRRGYPASGAEISNVIASGGVFYDSLQGWIEGGATGNAGAALIIGVPEGAAELTARDTYNDKTVVLGNVPVRPDAITFVTIDFTR